MDTQRSREVQWIFGAPEAQLREALEMGGATTWHPLPQVAEGLALALLDARRRALDRRRQLLGAVVAVTHPRIKPWASQTTA